MFLEFSDNTGEESAQFPYRQFSDDSLPHLYEPELQYLIEQQQVSNTVCIYSVVFSLS